MKFWPFPVIRIRPTDDALSRLFIDFSQAPDLEILPLSPYRSKATCSIGSLEFWDSNRWYGWASDGAFTSPNGRRQEWKQFMPSRYAARKFAKVLKEKQGAPISGIDYP